MAKRIVLCFDGTWNAPSEPDELQSLGEGQGREDDWFERVDPDAGVETNACRFYRSVLRLQAAEAGAGELAQIKWYDKGVGTDWYRLTGGAFGIGLSRNVRQGYKFLSDNYEKDDAVFVLGFSRGTYTARSLVGLIRNCGLLPKGSLPHAQADENPLLTEAYDLYRRRDAAPDSEEAQAFRRNNDAPLIPIRFLGVWDTVGALGVPIGSFDSFNRRHFEFHDTELSKIVAHAFHAVAIDEHRKPYAVTLWDPKKKPNQTVEQRWFLGAHADVGGGYPDRRLSDIALRWMQAQAQACGLALDPAGIPAIGPDHCLGPISDSFSAFARGLFRFFYRRHYRPISETRFGLECIDESVLERCRRDRSYRPKNAGFPREMPSEDMVPAT